MGECFFVSGSDCGLRGVQVDQVFFTELPLPFVQHRNHHRLSVSIEKAGQGEYCFCELQLPQSGVETIIVYRWNRHYPADQIFPEEWLQCRSLKESREFAGSSHEKITREVYAL